MSVYLIVNQFVPLDMLVAIEICKLVYTGLMENDVEMVVPDYDKRDTQGFVANHLGLHEELALVEYIFCDKTGTLTQNELVFRAVSCSDGTKLFYDDSKPIGLMRDDLEKANVSWQAVENFDNFFRCIAICNDCITVKDKDKPGKVKYNGPSVDEVTLNEMAQIAGIGYFLERDSSSIKVQVNGEIEEY